MGEGRIAIAKIAGAHGVKGLVKILPYDGDFDVLSAGPLYTAESGGEAVGLHLKNRNGKFILAAIDGITERDGAEALRGTELFAERAALPAITDENTFYHADLIGLAVCDENGASIGRIIAVDNFGAGDLLEIRLDNGGDFYLPFTGKYVCEIKAGEFVTVKDYKDFTL